MNMQIMPVNKGRGTDMAVVNASSNEVKLLARLMRAEAEGEGNLGMLMVGNVGVNRVLSDCIDFKNIRNIRQMVFQSPGGFEATQKGYFYQRARNRDIRLARRAIKGERHHPATNSLWYFRPTGDCPAQWFNQVNSGRYKAHCFFIPKESDCPSVFRSNTLTPNLPQYRKSLG
jgi:N-acetylmuramoyl-L-alanine amidase